MSVSYTSIQAFVNVLESKPDLISSQDWVELDQLASNLPEDAEDITEKLENWLKPESHSQIFQAYKQILTELIASSPINSNANLGIGKTKSSTPVNQPSESAKQLLENAIKKNSPLLNSPPPQQQP
ncbi:hypothetical protein [Microseira wollei]|uniref:Uncharacterized protein n=1 Tax=Microseira wollei NIES-4236 TaxID=2530354 RepID=A0AAV3XUN7_9CYAN|nr:hypothetical protein [Microseira wollei]GET44502.1 hypothetical protein MiSe_93320 [Microseira wollei NIES-4236]